MFLTKPELKELTGRARNSSQAMALRQMGIEHKIRPNGSVAALREHVQNMLGLKDSKRKQKNIEPNWGAI